MSTLFGAGIEATDEIYLQIRDNPRFVEVVESLEQLWQVYEPYADTNFLYEFPRQFVPRFWEMYLACTFLDQGLRIKKVSDSGPDFSVIVDVKTVWIEATVITGGVGKDSVQGIERRAGDLEPIGFTIPEGRILLRYRNGIEVKHCKYKKYIQEAIIDRHDPYVIAILDDVPLSFGEAGDEFPMLIKAVYGIGVETWDIDWEDSYFYNQRYTVRRSVKKLSGSPVSTDIFLNNEFTGISGILVSRVEPMGDLTGGLGSDFVFVHNVNATNPLDRGLLNYYKEYWIDDDNRLNMQTSV